jgi:hypothetical protein
VGVGGGVLRMAMQAGAQYYKCALCGSEFSRAVEAETCCDRAKVMVLCDRLRENFSGATLEEYCNAVRSEVISRRRQLV